MKKTKLAGENISLKTRKNEDPLVMAWLNMQSNLMDSLRYLVENEIMQHGVRNLQMFIPMERAGIYGHGSSISQQMAAAVEAEAEDPAEAAKVAIYEDEQSIIQEEIDDEDIEAWS
ncbi:hypothetical protein [Paenibacillus sp. BK720]|uniref:hypothetical protein n=1 Tax=Paenibacillus sp. BK720 TaxID=2587092 RepID=UPI001420B654|nr:hypothetical protein [Paenibacillus sp. BK720]NIK71425.1 hypothetical protein [Paenibacillus sp. BK720]